MFSMSMSLAFSYSIYFVFLCVCEYNIYESRIKHYTLRIEKREIYHLSFSIYHYLESMYGLHEHYIAPESKKSLWKEIRVFVFIFGIIFGGILVFSNFNLFLLYIKLI